MRSNCFNPYKDLCSLIEYILRDVGLYVLYILYPSGVFMWISLSNDPYRYVVTTSINRISKFSFATQLIKNMNVIVSITGAHVSSQSIPGLYEKPCATSHALYLII